MALRVSPARLRDELTDLYADVINRGLVLLVEGRGRPPIVVRRFTRRDTGHCVPLTRFRRNLHRVLREVERHPVVVTMLGDREMWVGLAREPHPDEEAATS